MQASSDIGVFNFDQLCGIAISRLGLSAPAFYELSPAEYQYALYDQQQREKMILEVQIQNMWEVSRNNLLHLYRMNPYVKKKPKKATDVFELRWDRQVTQEQDVESMKKVLLAIHESQKNKKPLKKRERRNKEGEDI